MKLLLVILLCGTAVAASSQNNVLTDRGTVNLLGQTSNQLNTGFFYNAPNRPPGSQSEGCTIYQNVNDQFYNYSLSLYSDLNRGDLYLNTGTYGTAGSNWLGWNRFLHSGNFSSYALPLAGGNVTGGLNVGGNVGIGTTNPGNYQLAVEGKVGARSVVVTHADWWADYVFEPDYQLPTLASVEAFVKENKHLPEVPTAKQVMESGIDLGANQTVLLKKVEELTLYAIEQDKKIVAQEAKLAALAARLEKLDNAAADK